MMDFNMWEITALVALAIVVFGPEKLPELARKAARILSYLRRIGNDARGQLREFDNLRLSDLNPKALVARHLLSGDDAEDLRQLRAEALATGQLVRESVNDAVKGSPAAGVPDAASGAAGPAGQATPVGVAETVPYDPEAT